MSGIELKPISDSENARANFLLPLGKTVIGRGSVLGVSDKRVSRNHGVVEIEDGILKIMSTHTNPTFYRAKGMTKLIPLPREVWQTLQHGDRIALTPDQHVYEVVIDERPINKDSQSLGTSLTDSPIKQSQLKQQKQTEDKEEKEENNKTKESPTGNDDKSQSNNAARESEQNKKDEEGEVEEDEMKDRAEDDGNDDDDEEDEDEADASHSVTQSKARTVKLPGQKEIALPLQKERKLPDWMANLGSGPTTTGEVKSTPTKATKGRGRPKAAGTPTTTTTTTTTTTKAKAAATTTARTPRSTTKARKAKPLISDEGSDDDDYKPAVKKTPSKGRGRPKDQGRGRGRGTARATARPSKGRQVQSDDNDGEDDNGSVGVRDEDDDDEDYEGAKRWGHGKTRNQASVKRQAKHAMDYSEDFIDSDEEDEEEEIVVKSKEDEGSDWEPESHSPALPRSSSKGKRGPGRSRTQGRSSARKRTGGRLRFSTHSSDDVDSDMSEQEVYVPRPTKRSGRLISSSQETGSSQDVVTPRKRTKKTDNGKDRREVCQYGKKCYRKNPQHLQEFSHHGDSDYESPRSEDDAEEDDHEEDNHEEDDHEEDDHEEDDHEEEQEECPFGPECYRKNKQHLKQYKHTKAQNRPKRQAARKKAATSSASVEEDNTYNYDDSFIDDGSQDTGKITANTPSESGSSWTPVEADDN